MKTTCLAAGLFPHPPIMIPEIGGKELAKMKLTVDSETAAMALMAEKHPDTVILMTPHNLCYYEAPAIFEGKEIKGSLSAFGRPDVSMTLAIDTELTEEIIRAVAPVLPLRRVDEEEAKKRGQRFEIDWGAFVPMYYLLKAGFTGKIVLLSPCFSDYSMNEALGRAVERTAARIGRKIAVIASGDLSHKMTPDSPNGYTPNGIVFDNAVMDALRTRDLSPLTAMTDDFIEEIAMCGLPSVYFLSGVLGGRKASLPVISHEGPFGIGYGIALFLPEETEKPTHDSRVTLAKETIAHYLETGSLPAVPGNLPPELYEKAGVFVSLHEFGALRGCIGTFLPCYSSVAEEIIHNAKAAATEDPRFPPLSRHELDSLDISVDVLSRPVPAKPEELDARKYGVLVRNGNRRGLLLPDLDGIDTPEEQIAIARQKAGIAPEEEIELFAFTVERYV